MTDLNTIKEQLGITGTNDDALLTRLIAVSKKIIENYCKRTWVSASWEEKHKGSGTRYLNVLNYPIETFTSLQQNDGTAGDQSWTTIPSDEYYANLSTGQIYMSRGFYAKEAEFLVKYDTQNLVPADIEQACIEIVSYLYNNRKTQGMKSERLGEYSYTKEERSSDVIKDLGLDLILEAYREPTI